MGIKSSKLPDEYLCHNCYPRYVITEVFQRGTNSILDSHIAAARTERNLSSHHFVILQNSVMKDHYNALSSFMPLVWTFLYPLKTSENI